MNKFCFDFQRSGGASSGGSDRSGFSGNRGGGFSTGNRGGGGGGNFNQGNRGGFNNNYRGGYGGPPQNVSEKKIPLFFY